MERFKNNRYLIFALIFALLNMGAIFLIFGFQQYSDSLEYFGAIHWFQGKTAEVAPERILRPLGPLFALPFEFLGEGAGLIVQNIIFYLLCAFLFFKIAELIYHNQKQALLASLFFVTATQVIESGLAYLTDMGAWFFYLLSLFLTLLYFKNLSALPTSQAGGRHGEKLIILNGLLSGTGFLMKENGGLGILFFGIMILFSKELKRREKILKLIKFGIFFLIPIAALQIFMQRHFQFTSLNWFFSRTGAAYTEEGIFLTFLRYLGQLFRTLGILWIFFFIGLWQELKNKDWERIKIYLALLPASLSFLAWPTAGSGRIVFIFAPLGILLATYGCRKLGVLATALLVLAVLIFNYTFCLFNSTVPFTDIIYTILKRRIGL